MSIQLVDGRYKSVSAAYMRARSGEWALLDDEGKTIITRQARAHLYYWAKEQDIEIVTVH